MEAKSNTGQHFERWSQSIVAGLHPLDNASVTLCRPQGYSSIKQTRLRMRRQPSPNLFTAGLGAVVDAARQSHWSCLSSSVPVTKVPLTHREDPRSDSQIGVSKRHLTSPDPRTRLTTPYLYG